VVKAPSLRNAAGISRPGGVRLRPARRLTRLACLLLISTTLVAWHGPSHASRGMNGAAAQATYYGAIEGRVISMATGEAVAGARVSANELGLETTSDAEGQFIMREIPLESGVFETSVSVSASGFGQWEILGARVLAEDTLLLEVELAAEAITVVMPPPRAEQPDWPEIQGDGPAQALTIGELSGDALPATIRVRVTGYPYCDTSRPYTVQVVDFNDYVKHVLPNEWVPSWPGESLRAGAMAAKMYAWYWIARGGKWSDADVYDSTCDQVYNPAVAYANTNQAIDFNWFWRLMRNGELFQTSYRAFYDQCVAAGLAGNCLGQWETYYHAIGNNGYDLLTWDEMLSRYYQGSALSYVGALSPSGFDLRFYGNGYGGIDRVKIAIDNPARPADIGAGDFTLEWWMKALAAQNGRGPCVDGGDNWIYGNTLFDRDVYGSGDYGDFGVSMADGRIAFGVNNGTDSATLCGVRQVADGLWHHIALTRRTSDGWMRIYVDGDLDAEIEGPAGDISYRNGRTTTHANDPYLVVGAEKHDAGAAYPSYSGWIDEIRLSSIIRYDGSLSAPSGPFVNDADTVALYHFDEGFGNTIHDTSEAAGGPSNGLRKYGGVTNGPEWFVSDLFPIELERLFLPVIVR